MTASSLPRFKVTRADVLEEGLNDPPKVDKTKDSNYYYHLHSWQYEDAVSAYRIVWQRGIGMVG
jgi:hypothetical protein